MANFIAGDNFEGCGGSGEKIIFEKMKEVFRKNDTLAYSKYPLFINIGGRRKEPDFILLDKEIGFIVIETKSYKIDNILNIEPNEWTMKDMYDGKVNPLGQVEDYAYSFCRKFDMNVDVKNRYKIKGMIALPYITLKEFEERNYFTKIDREVILFKDDLNKEKIIQKFKINNYLKNSSKYDNEIFKKMQSILGHENNFVEDRSEGLIKGEKKNIINKLKSELMDIDIQQENIGKSIPPGPQRIRGIAGSGKTEVLCQKAVNMHLKNKDKKIVITFFTQSLYEIIRETVNKYIKIFTEDEEEYSEESNLKIMHAWGSKKLNGLYRDITLKNNLKFLDANTVKKKLDKRYVPQEESINFISLEALKEARGSLKEEYDAIFIDEGQDLVGDDKYKYEGKQSFYYMAYLSLKKDKKIIWAYDELQSLNDTKIPTAKELFGDSNLVKGIYKGGIKKSEIMKKCYRTPYEVLTAAHAIGMGFFRKEGLLTGYTTKRDWENIGYKVVDGDFRKIGKEIVIEREHENSPNPIRKYYDGKLINFKKYSNANTMINDMVEMIEYDIRKNELNPSKDILIINLRQGYDKKEITDEVCSQLRRNNLNYYIPTLSENNKLKEVDPKKQKSDKFWNEGGITVTTIERAKGNEAYCVYIIGIEDIAKEEERIALRNKLFTAITRTKAWVNILAVGEYNLYKEIEQAIESKGNFKFKYTKPMKNSDDLENE